MLRKCDGCKQIVNDVSWSSKHCGDCERRMATGKEQLVPLQGDLRIDALTRRLEVLETKSNLLEEKILATLEALVEKLFKKKT